MALEKHRKSANELNLEAQVSALYGMLETLAINVKMALPSASIPDFRSLNSSSYMFLGTLPPAYELDGNALLTGRGPRFIHKYNTALTDAARQVLLDTLPQLCTPQRTSGWYLSEYFSEYRMYDTYRRACRPEYQSMPQSMEWQRFLKTLCSDENLPMFTVEGGFDKVIEELPSLGGVFGASLEMFTIPAIVAMKDGEKIERLLFVPLSDIRTYLVFSFRTFNDNNRGMVTSLDEYRTVRWADHEHCWAVLRQAVCTTEQYYEALEKIALWIGMPAFKPADTSVLFQVFQDLPAKIAEVWLPQIPVKLPVPHPDGEYEKSFKGKALITVPNVGQLCIQVPDRASHYGDYQFYFTPLDEQLAEGQVPTFFKVAVDSPRWDMVVKPLIKEEKDVYNLPVPRRQWIRVTDVIAQFLAFESPSIEFIPDDH
jgi:hypothetical protein